MIKLTPLELTLLDGVETEQFGYVRFLTVKDLLEIKEKRYGEIISTYALSAELLGLPKEARDFDLFFITLENGDSLSFKNGRAFIDIFLDSISILYGIEREDIEVNRLNNIITFFDNTMKKEVVIHRKNYDDFCSILLSSCMAEKSEKEEELKYINDEAKAKFERFLKNAKEHSEKKAITIVNMVNIVMAKLLLYTNKKELLSMTIFNMMFAYYAETAKESCDKNYDKYLAGAKIEELDLEPLTLKIKKVLNKEE